MYLGKRKTEGGSVIDIAPVLLDKKMRRIYYDNFKKSPNRDFLDFWRQILEKTHREHFRSASISFKQLIDYFEVEGDVPMGLESILVHF